MLAKDKGWLAAYFDVLSRVSRSQQAYFTEPHRLRLFYEALRAPDPPASATSGIFQTGSGAVASRLLGFSWRATASRSSREISRCGKIFFFRERNVKLVRKWASTQLPDRSGSARANDVRSFAGDQRDGPLQIYMAISELDSRRSPEHRLAPATVRLLARKFEEFSDQYRIFSEFPELSDESIVLFLDVAARR